MKVKLRTAYVLRFEDGWYLACHKKPSAMDGREWYKFGRKTIFSKCRLYNNRQSAKKEKKYLNDPTVEIVEVYITEPVQMSTSKVLEDA